MSIGRQNEELPAVDQSTLLRSELTQFRNQWSPQNPAFGENKWSYAVDLANRIDRGIDMIKQMGDSWEVEAAVAAARDEISLALTQNIPEKYRQELQMYVEMYSSNE